MNNRESLSAARDEWVCYWCGRHGQRGYRVLTGKAGERPVSVVCANRQACEKRQAAAVRREAKRGNWS